MLDRHPDLVLENCASGAMRSDFAMLSRLQMQSTSDQQDFLRYPPIAAAAPLAMLPEQAASWAYPQPEMSAEEVAFCLATGTARTLLRLGLPQPDERGAARARAGGGRDRQATARPRSPPPRRSGRAGIPTWEGAWTALGLATAGSRLITIWNRDAADGDVTLELPALASSRVSVATVFPDSLPEWTTHWDPEAGTLRVTNPTGQVGARVFRVDAVEP